MVLIKGGYQSDVIELTSEGARAVDPQMPARDQSRARIKLAIEDIEIFAKLHERFVGKPLPAKAALVDAAVEFEASKEAAEEAVETFILNLRFVGLLVTLSGVERIVSKDHALDQLPASGTPTTVQALGGQSNAVITAETCAFRVDLLLYNTNRSKHTSPDAGSPRTRAAFPPHQFKIAVEAALRAVEDHRS